MTSAGELPGTAIAAADCDYDGESHGTYRLYKTRADMRSAFARLARGARPIKGASCSGPYWSRGKNKRTEGRLAFVRDGGKKVLLWADDSERVLGVLRAGTAASDEVCAIWETRG